MHLIRPLVLLAVLLGLLRSPAARAALSASEIPGGAAPPILLAPAPALFAPADLAETTGSEARDGLQGEGFDVL